MIVNDDVNDETFRNYFIFSPAYSLTLWLMRSSKNFEKIAILQVWEMVSFWRGKTHFGKTPLKFSGMIFFGFFFYQYGSLIVIVLTKFCLCGIWMIFWPFFGTITYPKDNFCFHESIFQWQIKLISYRSEFWDLRRKSAFILSKWLFFQNSLMISWAT